MITRQTTLTLIVLACIAAAVILIVTGNQWWGAVFIGLGIATANE